MIPIKISAKKLSATFFATENGANPVREWLLAMSREDRKKVGDSIRVVEFGWPVGMPVCRPLGKGLYEVRTNLKDRIARVFFTIDEDEMVLLHGFIKKSQATPDSELSLALTRLQQWRRS
ncbi:MAG TPA: type II toxin-antitoxin system RelE/ParE family toxin [Rhizomicrobium sp.]|jgi:phage-related protein|nr:type II toxin-antitoxin system RelE/ParE family toxin [Rhizomicrobium sp.]